MTNRLESHELSAMKILQKFFDEPIIALEPTDDYKRKTPDFVADGKQWALKSPVTSRLKTLEKRFKEALKQSKFIILDLRKIALEEQKTIKYLENLIVEHMSVKCLLIITNKKAVVDLTAHVRYNKK